LRTPLTIITGHIEVTLIRQRSIEEYEELLRSVLDDIKNLNKLSNGLLDLAQVSLDIANITLQKVQVEDILYQAIENVYEKNPAYNILFEMEEQAEVKNSEYLILGEESLLKTAFMNLIENACKFSLTHRVKVRWRVETDVVIIDFIDHGMGISARDLPFIFQPFFRAENTKHIKGHGIGLPLTERIVQLHKGTISVESIEGRGSTFTVSLPFVNA